MRQIHNHLLSQKCSSLVQIFLITCSRVQPLITQRRIYLYKTLQKIYNIFGIGYENDAKLQK